MESRRGDLRIRVLLFAAWAYSVLHFFSTGIRQALGTFYGDFLASFPAWTVADRLGRLDLYRGSLSSEWGPPPIWHYGPVEHLITLPLFLSATLPAAYRAWLFVNYAFVAVTLVLAIGMLGRQWPGTRGGAIATIVILTTLNCNPFYEALTMRAIEIFELMLLVAAFSLDRSGRRFGSGLLVGIAAMSKFLPLIYLPYFVAKRNWRALLGSLTAILPIAIVTQWTLGWQHSGILLQLRQGSFLEVDPNQSLSGMVLRILRWTHADLSGALVSRIAIAMCLAGTVLLFSRRHRDADDLEWATLAAIMILVPPHNQNYYLAFLLFGFWVLFARLISGQFTASPWRRGLLAASFLLVALPVPLSMLSRIAGRDVFASYLHFGLGFAGAAMTTVLLVLELRASRITLEASSSRIALPETGSCDCCPEAVHSRS